MISTKGQVKTRALSLLDDDAQGTFKDAVFLAGFNEAWDALRASFIQYQIPFVEDIVTFTLAAGTTEFSPADAGIAGFGELIELEERRAGSTDRFIHVWEVDKLSQRDPGEGLIEFVWRLDHFETLGATEAREVRITYWDSGAAFPTNDGDSVGVDGAINFLAKYSASAMAIRKGYDELSNRYKTEAVGSEYEEGKIGGALFRLLQPMVRARQRVAIAPKPYSVVRRRWQKRGPFIAANVPAGGGGTPLQFSLFDGTVTGVVDGSNAQFFLPFPVAGVRVNLNGAALTPVQHYTFYANVVTFLPPYIPQPGADVLVEAWT
jgi:hypothetical protein